MIVDNQILLVQVGWDGGGGSKCLVHVFSKPTYILNYNKQRWFYIMRPSFGTKLKHLHIHITDSRDRHTDHVHKNA